MNRQSMMVRHFHEKFGLPIGKTPAIRRSELRAKLIREEAKECTDAIDAGDLVETIDGLCDLIYVCYGAALEFGIDLDAFFREVHRTNMRKIGGVIREDGKILKPEGWKPPNIERILGTMNCLIPGVR